MTDNTPAMTTCAASGPAAPAPLLHRARLPGPRALSLRARLISGAGLIAVLAFCAAALVVWGARETVDRIDIATDAQGRMETLGALSARVNDYAVVAVEATRSDAATRRDRLASRARVVRETFERAGAGLTAAVDAARDLEQTEQIARATRSLGLARMQALFEALDQRLMAPGFANTPELLRAELDSFATRFAPLLDQQIAEERRARDAAFLSIRALAGRLAVLAGALILLTLAMLPLYYAGLIRPLIDRLSRFGAVAGAIGSGATDVRMAVGRHDELGLVAAQVNRMAARLDRRQAQVARDRRRLEQIIDERTEELSRTNHRLERIDRSRRRFFADVGHELRTPLTVILAEADLGAEEGAADPAALRRSFRVIRARAERLNRRVNDLLRVARSETGEIALAEEPFDLAVAAREAMEDAQVLADRRRVALEVGPPPALPAIVLGDADWTRQVIAGLLDNAIRHSPEGGRVRVDCTADEATATALVTDEGSGVAPADRDGIFERFSRADTGSAGYGIGLALAKWVVERQRGRIACDSPAPALFADPKGPGAQFRIAFPRERAA